MLPSIMLPAARAEIQLATGLIINLFISAKLTADLLLHEALHAPPRQAISPANSLHPHNIGYVNSSTQRAHGFFGAQFLAGAGHRLHPIGQRFLRCLAGGRLAAFATLARHLGISLPSRLASLLSRPFSWPLLRLFSQPNLSLWSFQSH